MLVIQPVSQSVSQLISQPVPLRITFSNNLLVVDSRLTVVSSEGILGPFLALVES